MKEITTTFLFKCYIFQLQGTGKIWSYQNCIIKPTRSIIKSFLGDQITDYNHGIWFEVGIFYTYTLLRNANSNDLKNLYLTTQCKWQNVGCIRFLPQLLSQRKFKLTYKYSLASKKKSTVLYGILLLSLNGTHIIHAFQDSLWSLVCYLTFVEQEKRE